jgi:peroxiredoxin-like protein
MLLGAAATCYIITLAAIMERSNLLKEQLTMKSVGVVDVTNGVITYKKIIHSPSLVLLKNATEQDQILALKLTDKAESTCMISRALKGNVAIEVHADISLSND